MAAIIFTVTGKYDRIDIRFLTSGYSYMPCDRDFGIIEKRAIVSKAMIPAEVQDIVRTACLETFDIINKTSSTFYNFSQTAHTYLNTSKLHISSVSWIRITNSYTTSTYSCLCLALPFAQTFVCLCLCTNELFSRAYEHSLVRTSNANEPFVPFHSCWKNRFKSEHHEWQGE